MSVKKHDRDLANYPRTHDNKKRRGYWRSEQLCLIIYLFKYNYIYRRIFICVRAFGFVPLL